MLFLMTFNLSRQIIKITKVFLPHHIGFINRIFRLGPHSSTHCFVPVLLPQKTHEDNVISNTDKGSERCQWYSPLKFHYIEERSQSIALKEVIKEVFIEE